MNYRQDKNKKNNLLKIISFIVILFFVIFFYNTFFYGLSSAFHYIARPIFSLSHSVGNSISNTRSYFYSKKTLYKENEDLKMKILEKDSILSNYNTILDENLKLKEDFGRKNTTNKMIMAIILSKPNHSIYDVIVIDIGKNENIKKGDMVYAYASVPIGRVSDVYDTTAKVVLFSTAGEKTEVVLGGSDAQMTLVGRGGGNFEMIIPRDFELAEGTEVHLPSINPYVVAKSVKVISDAHDSIKKVLLTSPINIQNLKFVQIEK